ncbi:hypothetical protein NLU13_2659 [Sarocladium strictum]|uniref:Pumilio homology domain family member 3 n=1 Tax=Sarocladium strictum TaxID=5046 RepID=A0AA39GM10_SARSR|nr:hypothetical protein NLU13_2659 [Sarocladium strictum]
MATTARQSRGFANINMPTGSGDMTQQPLGSGFPVSNLYPGHNIWDNGPSYAQASQNRDRNNPSKNIGDQSDAPAGSSALNANTEPTSWGWNGKSSQPRSVSTSPNRTRDGTNGNAFYEPSQAAVGSKPSNFGSGQPIHEEPNGYNGPFASQKRSPPEPNYTDAMSSFHMSSRDGSLPPSRQSQGSPAFPQDIYRSHNSSNSIHSQRAMHNPSASFSANHNANQRAFNLNKQIDESMTAQLGAQIGRDGSAVNGTSFNPASQPFQLNPGSQTWGGVGDDFANGPFGGDQMSSLIGQFAAMKRPSIDRVSPASGYRLDSGMNPRSFAATPDVWNSSRPSSRDPRAADFDRRSNAQAFASNYNIPYYNNQYYMPQPFPPNYIDPYSQNFRQAAMTNYAMPHLNGGFPLANGNMPPVRPSRDQDPSKALRSALLDDFRVSNKSNRKYELRDITNHVVEFSGDQHGSRFIQQKLESANSDDKDQVFREIEPNAIQLMKDVFGNYVVQKFFEHGNQVQKKLLAEKMKGKVVDLSVQVYACRVVQKALEHVLVEQQAELTKELESEVLKVIRDQNGNHVIQKIIELVPRQHLDFIMDAVRGQVSALASHAYGCRVIQRMLEHGNEEDKAEIMNELHSSTHLLITDQYGNYVAQHVIQNGKPEDSTRIIELVMNDFLTLSKHKFASNVVEKCIEHGTAAQRLAIREQLTTAGSDGTLPLQQLMRDQYGNYVIQKLLGQLQGDEKERFVDQIKDQFPFLKKTGSTRQIQALEKVIEASGLTRKNSAANTNAHTADAASMSSINGTRSSSGSPRSTSASAASSLPGKETHKTGGANGNAEAAAQVQQTED